MPSLKERSSGIIDVGTFLFVGATMACLVGVTLTWPGTILDPIWSLNVPAYAKLAPLGKTAGIFFLMLSAMLAVAGTGGSNDVDEAGSLHSPSSPHKCSATWSTPSPAMCLGAPSGS